jgi:WD40 repeat protein
MIQLGLILQNRYRVVQQLGAGGFAETFEVNDRDTPKVLKVLDLDNFSSPGKKQKALSLFQREAHVLMRLNHPGIPRVEGDGYFTWSDGIITRHCLVMEKIEGRNLQKWLQQNGNHPITQTQAIDWLKQLVVILDKLHEQQYFHRDIKPENIMLKPDGQLVLIDFGAVREVTNTYLIKIGDEEVTGLYTPGYAPLEQMNGKAVPQSDFYALGRTFVHLLTGKHPHQLPEDDGDLIWRDCATQVSEPLADLIDELMAFLPKQRPENSQMILQRLAELELNGATELSVVLPTKLKGIGSLNTRSRWLKPSPKIRNALIGLAITVVATVTVLNFPKLTPPQRQPPAPQPTRSLPSPRRQSLAPLANISLLNTFREHSDFVHAVAFSPDGQTLASGSKDNTIKLLNPRTGKLLKTLSGASSEVWSVAISPDGRLLASGHWQDKTIKLWDLRTGKLLRTIKGHSGEVRSVAFNPDSQILASGSHDRTIKLWRVSTGKLLHTFDGHTDHVGSVAFSPDGKTLASASDDKTIKLWSLDTTQIVRTITGHTEFVLSVSFSPDGKTLVSGGADKTIRLWNPTTGVQQRTLTGHLGHSDSVWCLAISPEGRYIASGSYDNTIKLWNLRTGELLRTLREHSDKVYSVAFSRDGQTIASGGWDNTVRIWGVAP